MLKVRIVVKVKLCTLYQGFVACNEMVGSGTYISGLAGQIMKINLCDD